MFIFKKEDWTVQDRKLHKNLKSWTEIWEPGKTENRDKRVKKREPGKTENWDKIVKKFKGAEIKQKNKEALINKLKTEQFIIRNKRKKLNPRKIIKTLSDFVKHDI